MSVYGAIYVLSVLLCGVILMYLIPRSESDRAHLQSKADPYPLRLILLVLFVVTFIPFLNTAFLIMAGINILSEK